MKWTKPLDIVIILNGKGVNPAINNSTIPEKIPFFEDSFSLSRTYFTYKSEISDELSFRQAFQQSLKEHGFDGGYSSSGLNNFPTNETEYNALLNATSTMRSISSAL